MFFLKVPPFLAWCCLFQGAKASLRSRVEETSDTQMQFNDYAPKVLLLLTHYVLELLLKVKIFGSVLCFPF